jgi:hypothetical protein
MVSFVAVAPAGEVSDLARQLARRLAARLGLGLRSAPPAAMGTVRPYVRAAAALTGGDPVRAGHELDLADPRLAGDLAGAREVAEMVSRAPRVAPEGRIRAAITAGDAPRAVTLADATLAQTPGNVSARAGKARALLAMGEASRASDELKQLGNARKNPDVLIASTLLAVQRRAHNAGSVSAGDEGLAATGDLAQVLRDPKGEDGERVLAFVSGAPPNALPSHIEDAAVTAAAAVAGRNPGLASAIAVRAVTNGVAAERAAPLVKLDDLDRAELSRVQTNVAALGPAGQQTAAAVKVEVDKRQAAAREVRLGGLQIEVSSDDMAPLMNALRPLLTQFPALDGGGFSRVMVLRQEGGGQSFLWPTRVRPYRLATGMMRTLWDAPYELGLALPAEGLEPMKNATITDERLADLADETGVDAIFLFRMKPVGLGADVTLTMLDAPNRKAYVAQAVLPGFSTGVVGPNPLPLVLLLAVAASLFMLVGRHGDVTVRVETEGTTDRVMCLVVTRSPDAPDVGDPQAFGEATRKAGAIRKARSATLVERTTLFEKLPAGKWYVHLYGTYKTGKTVHVIQGERFSAVADVKKRETTVVQLALLGRVGVATINVVVMEGDQPVAGASVWLDEAPKQARRTGTDGEVLFEVVKGKHVVHISVRGMQIRRSLEVIGLKMHEVSINLAWERRADDASRALEQDEEYMAAVAAHQTPPPQPVPREIQEAAAAATEPPSVDEDQISLGDLAPPADDLPVADMELPAADSIDLPGPEDDGVSLGELEIEPRRE